MLTHWTRFDRTLSMMDELQRRMNRLFAEYEPARAAGVAAAWPPVNLYDAGESLVVEAMVPGLSEDELDIRCNQGVLTLSGERKAEGPEGYRVHRQERGSLRFSRSFSFPCEVDLEKATAHVKHGVLTVTLPKSPEAKPRQIAVKAE